jgi:hypothetical protein
MLVLTSGVTCPPTSIGGDNQHIREIRPAEVCFIEIHFQPGVPYSQTTRMGLQRGLSPLPRSGSTLAWRYRWSGETS